MQPPKPDRQVVSIRMADLRAITTGAVGPTCICVTTGYQERIVLSAVFPKPSEMSADANRTAIIEASGHHFDALNGILRRESRCKSDGPRSPHK